MVTNVPSKKSDNVQSAKVNFAASVSRPVCRRRARRGRRWPVFHALAVGLSLLSVSLAPGQTPPAEGQEAALESSREYTIKAAYLYNFARYVNWPEGTFKTPDAPIVIGVLGENPFGNALATIASKKRIDGRPIVVRQFASLNQYTDCHVLFIVWSVPEAEQQAAVKRLGGTHVLLVGETPTFTQQGGVVSFFVEENRVRFEINLAAARREDLKISSKLLNLAKLVGQSNGGWARMADSTPLSGGWPSHTGAEPGLPRR